MSVFNDDGELNAPIKEDVALGCGQISLTYTSARRDKVPAFVRMSDTIKKDRKKFCLCHPTPIHRMASMVSGSYDRKNYRIVVTVQQCSKCKTISFKHVHTEVE